MKKITLLACIMFVFLAGTGRSAEYANKWVKYADDKSTSYSIDKNSISKNDSGNYYVLVMMVPYKNNVFNKKLKRTDVAYVYSEQEVDLKHNLSRIISLHVYNKKGDEVTSDTYSMKGDDIPKNRDTSRIFL